MAVYNEILAGRFNRALQKFLSMKGSPPAPQLASEIMPVVPLFWGVEDRYLEGWNRYGNAQSPAAGGAGNFAAVQLRNPGGSKVIGVIEKCYVESVGATAFNAKFVHQVVSTDLTTNNQANSFRLDARGSSKPSLIPSQTGNFGANPTVLETQIGLQGILNFGVDVVLFEEQEITVLPGDAFVITIDQANLGFQVSFTWRERPLEDSEVS